MARILVIDDEASIRRSVRKLLARAGHEVDEAADGAAGIAMHAAHRYDVIMTDLRMPVCDGIEVITTLRQVDHAVRIILMSGGDQHDIDVDRFGAVRILPKPFSMQTLQSVVDSLVGKPAA